MKTVFVFIGALLAMFSLTGCVTAGIADYSIPSDERCVLIDVEPITHFDNQPVVSWKTGMGRNVIIIPAGEHRIDRIVPRQHTISSQTIRSGNTDTTFSKYIPYTEHSSVVYKFEAGKNYTVVINAPKLKYENGNLISLSPGVSITESKGVISVINPNMEIVEEGKKFLGAGMIGNMYIGPEFQGDFYMGWLYRNSFALGMGPRLGVGIINGKLDMKLMGEAGIGLGVGLPHIEQFDISKHIFNLSPGIFYYAGGLAEFYFPKMGIGIGGGITNAFLMDINGPALDYSVPYVELALLSDKRADAGLWSFFLHYYFTEPVWYSSVGIGIKLFF
jgi:hypothetical protein